MLTDLTSQIGFWIVLSTIFISIGTYKLLTKQNTEANEKNGKEIKNLGEKIDEFATGVKIEQTRMQANFEHMSEKITRIENDTAATRAKINTFSDSMARMQGRLQHVTGVKFDENV